MATTGGTPRALLLDGSSLIYRAFYALPPMFTRDGTPTSAVFGFTSMLLKLLEEETPDLVVMALEGGRTFRHEAFPEYKSHRPRTPDELTAQFPLVRAMAAAFGIPVLVSPGFEADDVLASCACQLSADHEVLLVTGDQDALQLVGPQISVLLTRKGVTEIQRLDRQGVADLVGVWPEQLPDFKALKGDPSDNIPGVPGIGEKTASALLARFGDLNSLLERLDEITAAKTRDSLTKHAEAAQLYRRLATVSVETPIPSTSELRAMAAPPDRAKLLRLFGELEFRALIPRLPEKRPDPIPVAAQVVAERYHDPGIWLAALRETGPSRNGLEVGIALELPHGSGAPTGLALTARGHTLVLESPDSDLGGLLSLAHDPWTLPSDLAELLRRPDVAVTGWDLKRIRQLLGLPAHAHPNHVDLFLAAYVLNPGRGRYSLPELARELGVADLPESTSPADVVEQLFAVRNAVERRLQEDQLEPVFRELEMPLIPILQSLEAVGVRVDPGRLAELSARLEQQIATVEKSAAAVVGRPVALGSPRQVGELLFGELALPHGRRTKTGYSTDADVLQDLALIHPLPPLVLEYRELSKLKSTYADALPHLIDPRDGRIHTRLNQAVAATGRLSSSEPNLQNIPIRTEQGREIRSAFIAAPGTVLVSADYSQIELRVMAHASGDPGLCRAFQEGRDVHAETASRVFGVPPDRVTSEMRRQAKTVNFAVLYGQREFGLSRQLRIEIGEARSLVSAYFAQFPGVLNWVDQLLATVRRDGYITTLPPYRRRRYLPGIHASNRNERLAAEREALNAPIQGAAADLIKAAMIRVDTVLRSSSLGDAGARMILQVHDELLFECPPERVVSLTELVKKEMEAVGNLSVPLQVDVRSGPNWRDLEAVPWPQS